MVTLKKPLKFQNGTNRNSFTQSTFQNPRSNANPFQHDDDDEAAAEIRKLTYQMAGVLEADKLAAIQDLLAEVAKGGKGNVTSAQALVKMTALLKSDLGGKSEARAELALRTVVFRAKAVQKYRSLMNKRAIFPYWEYRARSDGRTRDSHEALNGKLLPAGHPIWQRIFPPWGWG